MSTSGAKGPGSIPTYGIDQAGVAKIKAAIKNFVNNYGKKVENIGINTKNIQKGIKGSATEKTVRTYGDAMNNGIKQTLNKLNTFANELNTINTKYKSYDNKNTTFSAYTNNNIKKGTTGTTGTNNLLIDKK